MTDTHTFAGAYVLDALTAEEAEQFRRHLRDCSACRQEVAELRKAVTRMALDDATAPPPDLRRRVMSAVDRTPQLPPAPVQASDLPPDPPADRPAAEVEPVRRRRLPRMLAAAAAALVLGGGLWAVTERGEDGARPETPSLAAPAVEVFEAEDARTATVETANGGTLTVAVSPGRNEMAVDTRDLPDPGVGRVYQIWAVHGTEMVSAAVLEDTDRGAAMGMPDADTQVAFTIEPEGGSDAPTSDPIVVVDPSALV